MLTVERLRELLHYDRQTGVFTRLIKAGGQPVGAVAGSPHSAGYVELRVDGKAYLAHRLAWFYVHGEWPPTKLDHRDTIRTHNWIDNLRPASDQENAQNTNAHVDNVSGFKGVSIHKKSGRFRATIRVDGRQKHLGYFSTGEEASSAYQDAAAKQYGEFHRAHTPT